MHNQIVDKKSLLYIETEFFPMFLTHDFAILQLFLTHVLTAEKKLPVQQQLGILVFLK